MKKLGDPSPGTSGGTATVPGPATAGGAGSGSGSGTPGGSGPGTPTGTASPRGTIPGVLKKKKVVVMADHVSIYHRFSNPAATRSTHTTGLRPKRSLKSRITMKPLKLGPSPGRGQQQSWPVPGTSSNTSLTKRPKLKFGATHSYSSRSAEGHSESSSTDTRLRTVMKPIEIPWIFQRLVDFNVFIAWECLMCVVPLAMFLLLTYCAFFSYYTPETWAILQYLDFIFAFDIFFRLGVEIWRHVTHKPCRLFTIQYTVGQYLIDVVAIFPFTPIYVYLWGRDKLSNLNWVFYTRFNSFVRLYRAEQFFERCRIERRGNEFILTIITYLYEYVFFVQLFACIMYALTDVRYIDWMLQRASQVVDDEKTATWLMLRTENGMFDNLEGAPAAFKLYILTLEFIVAIVTTVGYGDIYPLHHNDIALTIIIMAFGSFVIEAKLSSTMAEFHMSHDVARFDLFFRLNGIVKYMREIKSPPIYVTKIVEYYKAMWNYREGVHEVNLNDVPLSMQEELMYDICEEMFVTSALFRDLDQSFLHTIARLAHINLYIPDMVVCREGVHSTDMHYIIQGELRVRGKFDPDNCALILRPGAILGEVNLLFPFPGTTRIETRTVCQILTIRKSDFTKAMDSHPIEMAIMRQRLQDRFDSLLANYKLVGFKSVSWVQKRDEVLVTELSNLLKFPIIMRKKGFVNFKVKEDICDDSVGTFIVTMKPFYASKRKDHYACYRTCNMENAFSAEEFWVAAWETFVLLYVSVMAFAIPYCSAFDEPINKDDMVYCEIIFQSSLWSMFILSCDVIVELYTSTPSRGIYYRFLDGWRVCRLRVYFWINVIACLPHGLYLGEQKVAGYRGSFMRIVFKSTKVLLFLNNLDNELPLNIFITRLLKSILLILYAVHILACILFYLVCDRFDESGMCNVNTWMNSYHRRDVDQKYIRPQLKEESLANTIPYLVSVWFSSAILTSAGYGDFAPQQIVEVIICIICMVIGVFLISYIIGGLAAALSCGVRPRLVFQQRLLAIKKFLEHHNLSLIVQNRVIEHYILQNELVDGITLPADTQHLLYDGPASIIEDTLLWEVEVFLEGVPIFTKCNSKTLTTVAKVMKRYLIPPNYTFVDRGEVRRSMYIIAKGSVSCRTTDGEETAILEATGHFGIRDLLFGEPHEFFIKTKSYCLLYALDFQAFLDCFEGSEDNMMEVLFQEKTRIHERINDLVFIRGINTHLYDKSKEKPERIRSFILLPWKKSMELPYCTHEEYTNIFKDLSFLSGLFRYTLMPVTIHPYGLMAKVWDAMFALICLFIFTTCVTELFMQVRLFQFRCMQLLLDAFCWMNIYIKLHWAYYENGNLLISHPAKTAYNYIFHGTFAMDIAFVAPYELFLYFTGATNFFGYGDASNWYTQIRMARCLQIYRLPNLFTIVHNVFENRTAFLCAFYVLVLGNLVTLLGSVAMYLACPWFPRDWKDGDENRLLACLADSWVYRDILKFSQSSFLERWIMSVYFVLQSTLTVGFGDTVNLQETDLMFTIVITVFGFLVMQIVIADMIAAQVDIDENRARFLEERRCLLSCLQRELAPYKILRSIDEHLDFQWEASRGLQPREFFEDLHPALASDLFQDFVGDTLMHVPLFKNFSAQVLRSISQLLKKQYFLKGQRITRCGNLEFEMFVIAEGRVYMVDDRNNYMITLQKNDFFGELAMLYGKPRLHSAIAASKVEVFVLNADDFADLIEKYPAVKDEILAVLKDDRKEIFVKKFIRKKRKDPEKWFRKSKAINMEIGRIIEAREVDLIQMNQESTGTTGKEPKEKNSFRARAKEFSRKWIIGWGNEDTRLPFLYFSNSGYDKWRFKFLIHPNCMFWVILAKLVYYVYFMSLILTLYLAFFTSYHNNSSNLDPTQKAFNDKLLQHDMFTYYASKLNIIEEVVVFFYIILKFFVPFEISYRTYCKHWGKIVFFYVSDPRQFIFDAIGAVPIDMIVDYIPDFKLKEYLVFIKFVRLFHFNRTIDDSKNKLSVSTLSYKMAVSGAYFILLSHTLACILYYSAVPEPMGRPNEPSWVSRVVDTFSGIPPDEALSLHYPSVWYLRSLYFMVTIMTSCGFGEYLPQSFVEYVLVSITMVFGSFGVAIVLANLTTGIAAMEKAKREYFYKVKIHVNHLHSMGLSLERGRLLLSHYILLWEVGRGSPHHLSTSILPLTMQFDCCGILFGEAIMNCSFFGMTRDASFVRNVAIRLVHHVFLPGVNIVNQAEPGQSLYIIFKGIVCSYTSSDDTGLPRFERKFDKFDCFGHIPCLFKNMVYLETYRAETEVEILQLEQSDVLQVVKHYSLWKIFLEAIIGKIAGEAGPFTRNIFQDEILTKNDGPVKKSV